MKENFTTVQTAGRYNPYYDFSRFCAAPYNKTELYRSLRKSVPIIDAAINKLVRLLGTFRVEVADETAQKELSRFLKTVKVGAFGAGINAFVSAYFDSLLTYGTAVGEMVIGKGIDALYVANLKNVSIQIGKNPLVPKICTLLPNGDASPVKHPERIIVTRLNPEADEPYGTSILEGLPFVADILLRIYSSIGQNWDRIGNVRYLVTYKPQTEGTDRGFAKARAQQIAQEWSNTMNSSGAVKDFVAVGDIEIKAIGSDIQILNSEIPVRQLLEQIVAKLGIPPFLLGLSWSSTERMSSQQADLLTSEIEAYRQLLTPSIERICSVFLALSGFDTEVEIKWDDVTLQDITAIAQSELMSIQAQKIKQELNGEFHDNVT